MGLFDKLFGGDSAGEEPSRREMRRLAALVAMELKLYQGAALEARKGDPQLPDAVAREVARAFRKYADQVGRSAEAETIFCREVAAAIGGWDEGVVRSALQSEPDSPPAIEPR